MLAEIQSKKGLRQADQEYERERKGRDRYPLPWEEKGSASFTWYLKGYLPKGMYYLEGGLKTGRRVLRPVMYVVYTLCQPGNQDRESRRVTGYSSKGINVPLFSWRWHHRTGGQNRARRYGRWCSGYWRQRPVLRHGRRRSTSCCTALP